MLTHRSCRGLRATVAAAVASLVLLPLVDVGACVQIVMKAAGIPKNASGIGGFVNGAHALITPALVMVAAIAPLALLIAVLLAPVLLRGTSSRSRSSRLQALAAQARGALARVRDGLIVFRRPRLGLQATVAQLSAWALQALSCWILLVALGLDKHAGIGAAAAVLFAVNITAVLPATPANLGVFQAATAAVLHTGWHIGYGDGVAYGVILQAVEVTTAIVMGMPALLKEGMSWREVRLRAMHTAPVKLPARPSASRPRGAGAAPDALRARG